MGWFKIKNDSFISFQVVTLSNQRIINNSNNFCQREFLLCLAPLQLFPSPIELLIKQSKTIKSIQFTFNVLPMNKTVYPNGFRSVQNGNISELRNTHFTSQKFKWRRTNGRNNHNFVRSFQKYISDKQKLIKANVCLCLHGNPRYTKLCTAYTHTVQSIQHLRWTL